MPIVTALTRQHSGCRGFVIRFLRHPTILGAVLFGRPVLGAPCPSPSPPPPGRERGGRGEKRVWGGGDGAAWARWSGGEAALRRSWACRLRPRLRPRSVSRFSKLLDLQSIVLDPLAVQVGRNHDRRADDRAGSRVGPRNGKAVPTLHPPRPVVAQTHRHQRQPELRRQIDGPLRQHARGPRGPSGVIVRFMCRLLRNSSRKAALPPPNVEPRTNSKPKW